MVFGGSDEKDERESGEEKVGESSRFGKDLRGCVREWWVVRRRRRRRRRRVVHVRVRRENGAATMMRGVLGYCWVWSERGK